MTIESLRQVFEQGYVIERGTPPRIRLADTQTLLKTHQMAEEILSRLGGNPDARRMIHSNPKYPAYFAALDVIRVAIANLPDGSWAIYSHATCLKPHVIWKGADQQVNLRAFEKDSELNGLRAWALRDTLQVQII